MTRCWAWIFLLALGCSAPVELETQATTSGAIVGGEAVDPSSWPSVAWVNQGCTGVVIGRTALLTAAHCILAGSIRFAEGSLRELDHCSYMPQYSLTQGKDLAVCEFFPPVEIEPATLIDEAQRARVEVGTQVTLVGYGVVRYQDADTDAGTLRQVTATVVDLGDRELTIGESSAGTCRGDSGGPAWLATDRGYQLLGILSSGPSGICGPGFYSDLNAHRAWIDQTMPQKLSAAGGCSAARAGERSPWSTLSIWAALTVLAMTRRRSRTTLLALPANRS